MARLGQRRYAEGDWEKAVDYFVGSIAQRQDLAWTWKALGAALEPLQRWTEAAAAYGEATRLAAKDGAAHLGLGRALLKAGRVPDALRSLRRAANLLPESASCQDLLGLALYATGRRDEARFAYRRAISADPERASAHHHLGLLLAERGDLEQALEHLRRAAELAPERAPYHRELARASLRARDIDQAQRAGERAAALAPGDGRACVVRALTAEMEGRRATALALYRRALELDPRQTGPYYKLAQAGELEDLSAIDELLERPALSAVERAELQFARGEILSRRSEVHEAWQAYSAGNAALAAEVDHDPRAHRAHVRRIIDATPQGVFEARRGWGDPNRRPVFLVGLPCSGLSLVERALGAHPAVVALGEHDVFARLTRRWHRFAGPGAEYPDDLRNLDRVGAVRLAGEYLRSLSWAGSESPRLLDCTPGNVEYLGLVACALPNARVIHVRGDPVDTALAMWITNYGKHRYPFACDLEHLASHLEDQERLVRHWREVLPLRSCDVAFEDLVSDPAGQAARLAEFLDLSREDLPAFPVDGRRTQRVGLWRDYRRFLGPLGRLREE